MGSALQVGAPRGGGALKGSRPYAALSVFAGFFLFACWPAVRSATIEMDLWWMIPTLTQSIEGRSSWEVFQLLWLPAPAVLTPVLLKAYLLLSTPMFGFPMGFLVLINVLFHAGSAFLLFWVAQDLGLERRAALFSALVALTLFPQFHAILWPPASQHVIAVFTLLLLLHGYFRGHARLATGAALLASVQRSGLLGPALLLADLPVSSRNRTERVVRFRRWLPLFWLSGIYPCFLWAYGQDSIISSLIARSPLPGSWRHFISGHPPTAAALLAKALLFLAVYGVFLGLFRLLIGIRSAGLLRRIPRGAGLLGAAGLVTGLLAFRDSRHLLWPYNAVAPLVTMTGAFLEPIRTALQINSAEMGQIIPAQIEPFTLFLTVIGLALFGRRVLLKKRRMLLLLPWYGICLLFMWNHPYESFPLPIPSRYFIYLTPIFAILFSSVWLSAFDGLMRRLKLKATRWGPIGFCLLAALCLSNLAAIRLASWRGRLVNTYYLYDDRRAVGLIREDLEKQMDPGRLSPADLSVEGVTPVPLKELLETDRPPVDPDRQDNFRILLGEALGNPALRGARINAGGLPAPGARVYRLEGAQVMGPEGNSLGTTASSEEAIRQRPFLLRELLGPGLRLEDARWISGGIPLREWLNRVSARWHTKTLKHRRVVEAIEEDLSQVELALIRRAYEEERLGRPERSRQWLSILRFLEERPETVTARIEPLSRREKGHGWAAFLEKLRDPAAFEDPLPWRMDDYGFGRFLLRILTGWDLRSGWDRRLPFIP